METLKLIESPKPLNGIIERLKEDLLKRFPDQKKLIEDYAVHIPRVVDTFLAEKRGIDDICAFFRDIERHQSKEIPQKLQDEIRAIRIQIGEQIRLGRIVLTDSGTL